MTFFSQYNCAHYCAHIHQWIKLLKQNSKVWDSGTPSKAGARGDWARGWHFRAKEPLLGDGKDDLCSSMRWIHHECLERFWSDLRTGLPAIRQPVEWKLPQLSGKAVDERRASFVCPHEGHDEGRLKYDGLLKWRDNMGCWSTSMPGR